MKINIPITNAELSHCLPRFINLIGEGRWKRRVAQLNSEAFSSPFLWKIVSDYHWLEICLGYQSGSLERTGSVLTEEHSELDIAALIFAASVVRIYENLSESSKLQLAGRLRDCLKARAGFSGLYLEIDVATRLMEQGYEVDFSDMNGSGNYDLSFEKNGISGEIECKSISVDAGRQVHRRDFYRLMESVRKGVGLSLNRHSCVMLITLRDRLLPSVVESGILKDRIMRLMNDKAGNSVETEEFCIERLSFEHCLPDVPIKDPDKFLSYCRNIFGENAHVAGGICEANGPLFVVKSRKEDDTSKPWLEAMRKASEQLTGGKPSIIIIQFQDVEIQDLLSYGLRRRAAILSNALFRHYGNSHVNAVCIQGYRNIKVDVKGVATFGFSIINSEPLLQLPKGMPEPFLMNKPVQEYLEAMGENDPGYDLTEFTFSQLFGE